jgi:hypothetical protein
MEAVNPNQVSFVETLDDNLSKESINAGISRPESGFIAAATVDRALLDIVMARKTVRLRWIRAPACSLLSSDDSGTPT